MFLQCLGFEFAGSMLTHLGTKCAVGMKLEFHNLNLDTQTWSRLAPVLPGSKQWRSCQSRRFHEMLDRRGRRSGHTLEASLVGGCRCWTNTCKYCKLSSDQDFIIIWSVREKPNLSETIPNWQETGLKQEFETYWSSACILCRISATRQGIWRLNCLSFDFEAFIRIFTLQNDF